MDDCLMQGAWFDKLTMRKVGCKVSRNDSCQADRKCCRIEFLAILVVPHGELVEPRTVRLANGDLRERKLI